MLLAQIKSSYSSGAESSSDNEDAEKDEKSSKKFKSENDDDEEEQQGSLIHQNTASFDIQLSLYTISNCWYLSLKTRIQKIPVLKWRNA